MSDTDDRGQAEQLVRRLSDMADGAGRYDLGDYWSVCEEAAAEIARLLADAARYRWLRDEASYHGRDDGIPTPWVVIGTCAADAEPHWQEDLDALIDAEMQPNTR